MYPLRMAKGVLRSCAAEARAFVVLRKRSRNCSSSRDKSSVELGAESRAVTVDGRRSFGLVPVGETAGLFSDIEAMENQLTSCMGERALLPSERGDTVILCQVHQTVNWKPAPNRYRSEKCCTFYNDLKSVPNAGTAKLLR